MKPKIGIYIHIPFCSRKCYYCNFISYPHKESLIQSYIDAVCMEILQNAEILSEYQIGTIYIGGGTPSYIDSIYIMQIMNTLNLFGQNEKREVTIEINPSSITLERLLDYKKCGINRISIGVQSTQDDILKKIGRTHTKEDVIHTLQMCKEAKFTNLSIDLIYPLPDLSLEKWNQTLEDVTKLVKEYSIKHISVYNLEIHENTKLDFLLKENYVSLVDEDTEYQMKELLEEKMKENHFQKYEISNFCLEGFQSKHNCHYWNQGMYLGFGAHASSFFANTRYKNTDSIEEYISSITKSKTAIRQKDSLDKLSLMKEFIILKLRLVDGFTTVEFSKFNQDLLDLFSEELNDLEKKQLIKIEPLNQMIAGKKAFRICLTKRGMEVANIVWEQFI